ncbi:MAG: hypothetical protein IPG74_10470 [Flavobacteriales bacterium]|nr:hypothetical protein [Flavobacteriales bacterium]
MYNNAISEIISAYTGAASPTRAMKGIFLASTAGGNAQTYEIWNNAVSIDGSSSPNVSNVCFESLNVTTGPIITASNNILANHTVAQTGTARHFGVVHTNSTIQVANTGTSLTNNDIFIANDAGVTGFTALGGATNFNGAAAWALGVTSGQVSGNINDNPIFVNTVSNLTPQANEVNGTGAAPPGYITNDLNCAPRGNDMGAYEFTPPTCFPPTGSVVYVQDCGNNQFFLDVTVTNLAGAPGVDVVSDFGGNPGAQFGVGLVTVQLGPFPTNTNVVVSLLRNLDPSCDVSLGTYNFDCSTVGQNALSFDGVNDRVNCGTGASVNITGTDRIGSVDHATAWRTLSTRAT